MLQDLSWIWHQYSGLFQETPVKSENGIIIKYNECIRIIAISETKKSDVIIMDLVIIIWSRKLKQNDDDLEMAELWPWMFTDIAFVRSGGYFYSSTVVTPQQHLSISYMNPFDPSRLGSNFKSVICKYMLRKSSWALIIFSQVNVTEQLWWSLVFIGQGFPIEIVSDMSGDRQALYN